MSSQFNRIRNTEVFGMKIQDWILTAGISGVIAVASHIPSVMGATSQAQPTTESVLTGGKLLAQSQELQRKCIDLGLEAFKTSIKDGYSMKIRIPDYSPIIDIEGNQCVATFVTTVKPTLNSVVLKRFRSNGVMVGQPTKNGTEWETRINFNKSIKVIPSIEDIQNIARTGKMRKIADASNFGTQFVSEEISQTDGFNQKDCTDLATKLYTQIKQTPSDFKPIFDTNPEILAKYPELAQVKNSVCAIALITNPLKDSETIRSLLKSIVSIQLKELGLKENFKLDFVVENGKIIGTIISIVRPEIPSVIASRPSSVILILPPLTNTGTFTGQATI